MSLATLIEAVNQNLRRVGAASEPPAELLRRANDCQDRIAQELGIPLRYLKEVDATAPFALPDEARPGGLRYAERYQQGDDRGGVPQRLLTVAQANDLGIAWESPDFVGHPAVGRSFLLYDPANASAPVTPVGYEAGDLLRLAYVVKPAELAAFADLPFGGELAEYGERLLQQYLTFELLLLSPDPQLRTLGSPFYNDYKGLLEEAFNASRPQPWLPRRADENRRTPWRRW